MFDPAKIHEINRWQAGDLAAELPPEDDRHEYKSSKSPDGALKDEIVKAASAFWNSGGGLFVAGVDDLGKPDGGISMTVGRKPRREWIEQAVAEVEPTGPYVVHEVERKGASVAIGAN